jgi:hypothetical protein
MAAMHAGEKTIPEGEWIAIAELLLARGADVNARDGSGMTPLHLVASASTQDKYTAMAELLLARGADVNARDKSGMTPLHFAVKVDHRDMVDFLVAKGADINAKDNEGKTPLLYASQTIRMMSALATPLSPLPGEDPFVGTWQLNIAKSSFNHPGSIWGTPQSSITTFEQMPHEYTAPGWHLYGDMLRVINKSVDAQGKPGGFTRVEILDGKAHEFSVHHVAHPNGVAESNPSYDAISAERIDRNTIKVETEIYYNPTRFAVGVLTDSIVTRKISKDGRMMIVADNRGAAFQETRVYDKLCGNEVCR